ncbi:hypothetical protein like AT4G10320 [Hibiscus trionum]|uniref:Aminoacyl-tRNA synthetase class Ia domain-containing protein n=1 Tax=Hibiscus trionum TaxID=183268 RepID=A0A9W7JBU6_HIBTR|nr:hypothetical protein like AT4G10320 [Hibiscus trionum]
MSGGPLPNFTKRNLPLKDLRSCLIVSGARPPLSNFEAGENYKSVSNPKIMVAFPIVGDPDNAAFVAWTTTPWTLPSNLALCVNANFDYVKVCNKYSGKI